MYWVIVVIVFAVLAAKETRKKRSDPDYKSWMDDSPDWRWWNK